MTHDADPGRVRLPDADKVGDWAAALLGFILPAYGGFVPAEFWVTHLHRA